MVTLEDAVAASSIGTGVILTTVGLASENWGLFPLGVSLIIVGGAMPKKKKK